MNYVSVKFDNLGRSYAFKSEFQIPVGAKVVVDCSTGLQIAEVVSNELTAKQKSVASKWVVCMIDMFAHERRIEQEKKLQDIKDKMEARKKKLEEMVIYQMLAKDDPEMAELLKTYNDGMSGRLI